MKKFFMVICIFLASMTAFANEEVFVGPSYEGSQVERDYREGVLKELPVCLQWETRKQCINRRVCRIVCGGAGGAIGGAVGGGVGAGAGIGAGSAICNEVCDLIPECSNIRVCVRYSTSPGR